MPADVLPFVLFSAVGLGAYFVRGLTGAASAIVANACFLVLLGGAATGVVTLLDALCWFALVNVVATIVLAWAIREQLGLDLLARRFILGAVPVTVAFTLVLPRIDVAVLGVGLGAAIIAAGAYLAYRRAAPAVPAERLRPWAFTAGALSGILGGLYGMGGPVAVLFFGRAEPNPTRFRAVITAVSGTITTIRFVVLALDGVYTQERLTWAVVSLPAVGIGLALGYRVHERVSPTNFRLVLGVLVALGGVVGLLRTISV